MDANQINKHIDNIIDVITCADGGAKFMYFLMNIRYLATREDTDSQSIVKVVERFSKLLDVLGQEPKNENTNKC